MVRTLQERVVDLEAEAFRARQAEASAGARLTHLTDAVGDLSQDARSLRHEVSELRAEVRQHGAMLTAHGAMLRALLEHFGIDEPSGSGGSEPGA